MPILLTQVNPFSTYSDLFYFTIRDSHGYVPPVVVGVGRTILSGNSFIMTLRLPCTLKRSLAFPSYGDSAVILYARK
jgi:hypothetical protein